MHETTEGFAERASHFQQLRWSLSSLVLAGSGQGWLFPDRAPKPDTLASDYDHWSQVINSDYSHELSPAQRTALEAIDSKLATMSRDGAEFGAELWTESALKESPHWADVRQLATTALEVFGWTVIGVQGTRGSEGC